MTDHEILKKYSDLLIIQYRNKPKAVGTVEAFVNLIISGQLPKAIEEGFNIDDAAGVQLDLIGKIVGVTRDGNTFTRPVTLGDDDYRKLIRMKIFINNSDSSLYAIQELIALYFEGMMRVYDYRDMSMSYFLNSSFGTQDLVEVFINKNLLPKPMTVGLSSTIYHPTLKFFAFRTYEAENPNGFPFNTYESYNEESPWLLYAYSVNSGETISEPILTEDGVNKILQENGDDILA